MQKTNTGARRTVWEGVGGGSSLPMGDWFGGVGRFGGFVIRPDARKKGFSIPIEKSLQDLPLARDERA